MNSLLYAIDEVSAKWGQIVVPIFVDSEKSELAANCVGSAFLATLDEKVYLVTALHVVERANRHKLQVANINDVAVDVGGIEFLKSEKADVAIAPLLNSWLDQNGVGKIQAIPLKRNIINNYERTGIYLALGYPESKNRIDVRYKRTTRIGYGISLGLSDSGGVDTSISTPLFFEYTPIGVVDSNKERVGAPDLHGMSGGPCIEVLINHRTNSMAVTLAGVLVEWHEAKNRVVASSLPFIEME